MEGEGVGGEDKIMWLLFMKRHYLFRLSQHTIWRSQNWLQANSVYGRSKMGDCKCLHVNMLMFTFICTPSLCYFYFLLSYHFPPPLSPTSLIPPLFYSPPPSHAVPREELHDFAPDKEPLLSMLEGEIQAMYLDKPCE